MWKKIWIPVVSVLLVALLAGVWMVAEAFAQEPMPDGDFQQTSFLQRWRIARHGLGQVLSVSQDQFVVRKQNGQEYTLLVTDETRFRDLAGDELSFADLQVDQWVVVVPLRGAGQELAARLVVILPDDFDPTQFMGARGLITSVDLAASQFGMQNRAGAELLFHVDGETRFAGEVVELADLQPEMQAMVSGLRLDDGELLAQVVWARTPGEQVDRRRYAGRVSQVDLQVSAFSLTTRRGGEELNFLVDENTRFQGRQGSVQGLEDLEVEMVALVFARPNADGSLLALVVAAGSGDQLPKFEGRALGRVVSVELDILVIDVRGGRQIHVQVNDDTHFRSRVEGVQSLEDLQPGMIVAVGGKELGEGEFQYQADLVVVLRAAR
jgi:hypothetical protein